MTLVALHIFFSLARFHSLIRCLDAALQVAPFPIYLLFNVLLYLTYNSPHFLLVYVKRFILMVETKH